MTTRNFVECVFLVIPKKYLARCDLRNFNQRRREAKYVMYHMPLYPAILKLTNECYTNDKICSLHHELQPVSSGEMCNALTTFRDVSSMLHT